MFGLPYAGKLAVFLREQIIRICVVLFPLGTIASGAWLDQSGMKGKIDA
jgi:hypothetical protein